MVARALLRCPSERPTDSRSSGPARCSTASVSLVKESAMDSLKGLVASLVTEAA